MPKSYPFGYTINREKICFQNKINLLSPEREYLMLYKTFAFKVNKTTGIQGRSNGGQIYSLSVYLGL